jgi:hypothetical protein
MPATRVEPEGSIVLTPDEVQLLRFTCDLHAEPESPLGPLEPLDDAGVLEGAARSLAARRLLDPERHRADRELLRRLLILSQPDARIVMLKTGPEGRGREADIYERASAYVPYGKDGECHVLGVPRDFSDVLGDLLRRFKPRRSRGDFVELAFDTDQYFVFSLLAGELARKKAGAAAPRPPTPRTEQIDASAFAEPPTSLDIERPSFGDPPRVEVQDEYSEDSDHTPLVTLLRRVSSTRRSIPQLARSRGKRTRADSFGEDSLRRSLDALVDRDVAARAKDRYTIRPYLHDLALGLSSKARIIVSRFDFGLEDWFVRDATFVAVPGSLFLVRGDGEGAIRISELDERSLESTIREAIGPNPSP